MRACSAFFALMWGSNETRMVRTKRRGIGDGAWIVGRRGRRPLRTRNGVGEKYGNFSRGKYSGKSVLCPTLRETRFVFPTCPFRRCRGDSRIARFLYLQHASEIAPLYGKGKLLSHGGEAGGRVASRGQPQFCLQKGGKFPFGFASVQK